MSDIDPDRPVESDDEFDIVRVLRAAGGRAFPAESVKSTVRAAVYAEWQTTVSKRRRHRRTWVALAASLAVSALGLWFVRSYFTEGPLVARVDRTVGAVQSRSTGFAAWHAPSELHVGDRLQTGADGRVALQLQNGVSLRLDRSTLIAIVDSNRIDLKSGAVYIDAGPAAVKSSHLRVGTPAGIAEHVGTQYEARIVNGGTRISVREGRVDVHSSNGNAEIITVGEQLLIPITGESQRSMLAASDPQWDWAAHTAPAFDIDGRTVHEFLTWVGRELGREIVFTDPKSEGKANHARLSGSTSGLTPADALPAVLATTGLRSRSRSDGKIEISSP